MKDELSSKDLSYVCDMFNWNLNIYNVCCEFEEFIEDEKFRGVVINMKEAHKDACSNILKVVK